MMTRQMLTERFSILFRACVGAALGRILCLCMAFASVAVPSVATAGYGSGQIMMPGDTLSVKFGVSGFRTLPNDVTAFISPVYDLNGEACALVKVVASTDFAFSSPLGVVKRINKTGEIWLYLPKGSKLLTIKHPQWGVIRDYRFRKPLESHVTYEMNIATPKVQLATMPDTIVLTKTVTDTVVVSRRKPKVPLAFHALFTVSMHKHGPSWGLMLAVLRRHGAYVHAQSDLRSIGKTAQTCDRDGMLPDSDVKPYYTGKTRHSNYVVTAGLVHRLCRWLDVFYGAGYGRTSTAWQLAESEGGGYVLNGGLTHKGVAGEAGILSSFGRFSVSASAITIKFNQWQVCLGVGVRL